MITSHPRIITTTLYNKSLWGVLGVRTLAAEYNTPLPFRPDMSVCTISKKYKVEPTGMGFLDVP